MRLFLVAALLMALAASGYAAAETWKNVPLVDAMCGNQVKADPDSHTAACALHCGASGMGLLTADGTFLKFDADGTKKALAAIKASKKADHLRGTVTGERSGNTVKVLALKLD